MKAPAKRVFTRISGTENSFIICNTFPGVSEKLDVKIRSQLARHLCKEVSGLSADGFICLDSSVNFDFKWDFYNSDGSKAEMCGNAARACALYFYYKIKNQKKTVFETEAGQIQTEILNLDEQIIQVTMPEIKEMEEKKIIQLDGRNVRGFFINTGVPHFVLQHEPEFDLAKKARSAPEFGKMGANITFVETDESDYIHAVTFERGVENFTLACGTGAVAAAAFQHHLYPYIPEVFVEMPGGVLSVIWKEKTPFLTGPVEMQFDFSLYEDFS